MEADTSVLEDGEITDDSCSTYTPLERPLNYSALQPNTRFPTQTQSESESDMQTTTESDTDSDTQVYRQKKPKMKPKIGKLSRPPTKQSKYSIWSTHLQEDVLATTLNTCDVSFKDRSRNVETYNYKLPVRKNNKRTRTGRKDGNLRLVQEPSGKKDNVKGSIRNILDLQVTLENTEEEIAKDIANKLCEEKEELICKITKVIGKEKAIKIFQEVKRIEEEGGMLIMNQSRRRTPGGVYFFLVKHDTDLTSDQHSQIFDEDKHKQKLETRAKQRKKIQKMKEKIAASKKVLPELLTRAEECVQRLVTDNDRSRKKIEASDVSNPPPTPETDCHENSGDGIDQLDNVINDLSMERKLQNYDDFLELDTAVDMDLF